MNPISDSNNGHFASLGIHVENNQSSGRTAYSQEFKANNGGFYTATVYSSKLNATPTEIETLISKAIAIAKNLGIGEGGLEKINITGEGDNPSIMGTYQSDGQNSSRVVDLLAHLKEQAASGSDEEKSASTIKLQSLKRITACFNQSLGVVSNEASTDLDVGEGLESPEFETPSSEKPDWGTAHFNREKNRYTNMGLSMQEGYNVFLNQGENSVPKYINATRIALSSSITYIAAQAPKKENVNDFWNMQIQEGADIVNLTQEFEKKEGVRREKADNYWDPPENSNAGEIGHKNTEGHKLVADLGEGKKVFQTTIEVRPWGKEYTFEVREDGGAPQSIKLFHHEKWPDFGVVDLSDLKTFISDVHKGRDPTKTNLTVHCSAGCGRTGTFIGVDVASQPINNQNAASLTNKMREFRSGMVQTKEQYDLIKQAFFMRNLPLIPHEND